MGKYREEEGCGFINLVLMFSVGEVGFGGVSYPS